MVNKRLEEYLYILAIIWFPFGVMSGSFLLLGLSMVSCGMALFLTYARRHKDSSYREVRLPNREEDDTVEIQTKPYYSNNPDAG